MTKSNSLVKIAALILVITAAAMIFAPLPEADAQETRVVRIWGRAEPWVEPPVLMVSPGTTVIWYNISKDEIKIVFEEGKKCADVTEAHPDFELVKEENCFVTTWVDYGATSSLRFMEPGVFHYVVEYEGRNQKDRGRIVVQE